MDHHVEPQPGLPEGAAAAVTEEATAASGQTEADAASEQVSLNGTHNDNEQQLIHDPAPLTSDAGALNGSQEAPAADPDTDAGPEAHASPEAEAGQRPRRARTRFPIARTARSATSKRAWTTTGKTRRIRRTIPPLRAGTTTG